jgi:hypothetical protein
MEWVCGDIFVRPNDIAEPGVGVVGHTHNFPHATFARKGWILLRVIAPDTGLEYIEQFCSPEYLHVRSLLEKYEPQTILRPIRFDDLVDPETGRKTFAVKFIKAGEDVPEGGTEIFFAPKGWHRLIKAEYLHELVALSPYSMFDCVYAHRDPNTGTVVLEQNGYYGAYQ